MSEILDGTGEYGLTPNQVVKLILYGKDGIKLLTCKAIEYEDKITFQEIYAHGSLGDEYRTIPLEDISHTGYAEWGTSALHFYVFEDDSEYGKDYSSERAYNPPAYYGDKATLKWDVVFSDEILKEAEQSTWMIADEISFE